MKKRTHVWVAHGDRVLWGLDHKATLYMEAITLAGTMMGHYTK